MKYSRKQRQIRPTQARAYCQADGQRQEVHWHSELTETSADKVIINAVQAGSTRTVAGALSAPFGRRNGTRAAAGCSASWTGPACSAARWASETSREIKAAHENRQAATNPLVGGTAQYVRTRCWTGSPGTGIDAEIRAVVRALPWTGLMPHSSKRMRPPRAPRPADNARISRAY